MLFYAVTFSVPTVSVIDCHQGHSQFSLYAIGIFLGIVFIIDCVCVRLFIKKELVKLELRNFYGADKDRNRMRATLGIYIHAFTELLLTQLGLFDIYTDFAFITIVATKEELLPFFVLSTISFSLTMLPKLYYFFLVGRVLCMRSPSDEDEKDDDKRLKGGASATDRQRSTAFEHDDDQRRKLVFRAYTFSEFRCQALCVDFVQYEISKTALLQSALKFSFEDLP